MNSREIEVEIVWWENSGLFVKKEALKKYKDTGVYYVQVMKYGECSNIPVKILKSNEKYSIISNYTNLELNTLKIDRKYNLNIYDQLVINNH